MAIVALKKIDIYARKREEWKESANFYCGQTIKKTFSGVSLKRKHFQEEPL